MGQVARCPNVTITVEAVWQILDVAVLDGAVERRPDGKVTKAPMPHLVPYSEPKVVLPNAITARVLLRQARLIPKRETELAGLSSPTYRFSPASSSDSDSNPRRNKNRESCGVLSVMPSSTSCNTPLSNFEAGRNYKHIVDPGGKFGIRPSDVSVNIET
ncbi:unnamed protein product [Heligmosomoides polygyrus]|uniref:Uncharacterized protein n=1 Tax=Heligmosomoides polygyrus TaxID=6339 RepID=A0A183GSV6_HELPZ|nr:unnamed protein product [Heligmosomoides polygyrus]